MATLPDGNVPAYDALRERAETALRIGAESAAVEFKAGAPWPSLKIAVVKTVMAMSNRRDGGLIVIGRPEDADKNEGVSVADLQTFDPDVIRDQIDEYASAPIGTKMIRVAIAGHTYIAIEISEFDDEPVICKKAHDGEDLRRFAIYVRSQSGRPRSTIVTSVDDIRAVLDLAVDKRMARFELQAQRRGYARATKTEETYRNELGDLGDA